VCLGHGEHALNLRGMGGCFECGVPKERVWDETNAGGLRSPVVYSGGTGVTSSRAKAKGSCNASWEASQDSQGW
jgi:hypothetical protein